jgi:hypothetical protein
MTNFSEALMLVELHVFSGRPNPRWELDEPHTRTLRTLIGALRPATRRASTPPGLGYAGFSFTDGRTKVVAYDGYVHVGREVFDDAPFTVERFLLGTLPNEHAPLRDRILAQLDRSRR